MNRRTFVVAGMMIPFMACSIIPDLIVSPFSGQWGTNLFWGLIFGFGWWAAQSVVGPDHWRGAAAFGILIWPMAVLTMMFLLSRFVWQTGDHGKRKAFLLLLAATSLAIVPAKAAMSLHADAGVPPDFNYLMASW